MKRAFDILFSFILLVIFCPVLMTFSLLIFLQDFSNPLYISERVGKGNRTFRMYKLRSMVKNADKAGIDSTASDDERITRIGKLVRKFKLDELTQLINVVKGEMSLVGPRPNVERETKIYSEEEKKILLFRPGITDYASIVFSDESEILQGSADADLAYNQLIRPGKSKLAIFYVENQTFVSDLPILLATVISIIHKKTALYFVSKVLELRGAPASLVKLASRDDILRPSPPPGLRDIVKSREVN